MKFNTSIPKSLKSFFEKELIDYQLAYDRGFLDKSWYHLERAHIIGQMYPLAHSLVHWKMLLFGFRIKSSKELFGQMPRLFFGGIKSFVGKVPIGNPGGANVPPFKSFPIGKELQEIFLKAEITK